MTPDKRRLKAKAYEIKGRKVKVAYPPELFESGNMSQILSSVSGNIFGMRAIRNLRLEDVRWPPGIIRSFCGPQFGIHGIRKIFGVKKSRSQPRSRSPKLGCRARSTREQVTKHGSGG
ncbi:MAG TPA: hypothetical protein EYP46_03310 [Hadesarchaea archaeon]|nr:hypothetical protein [Hadesarchaea archaeon]